MNCAATRAPHAKCVFLVNCMLEFNHKKKKQHSSTIKLHRKKYINSGMVGSKQMCDGCDCFHYIAREHLYKRNLDGGAGTSMHLALPLNAIYWRCFCHVLCLVLYDVIIIWGCQLRHGHLITQYNLSITLTLVSIHFSFTTSLYRQKHFIHFFFFYFSILIFPSDLKRVYSVQSDKWVKWETRSRIARVSSHITNV